MYYHKLCILHLYTYIYIYIINTCRSNKNGTKNKQLEIKKLSRRDKNKKMSTYDLLLVSLEQLLLLHRLQ